MPFYYGRWMFRRRAAFVCGVSFLGLSVFFSYHVIFTLELLPWNPQVERWCNHEEVVPSMLRSDSNEMTVVTMFIDLGVFKKGEQPLLYYSPYKYKKWMRIFGRMVNRVVAYIESDGDIEYFRKVRSCLPASHTRIIKIHRHEMQSFKHLDAIKHIYSNASYPKYYPNTIYPEYSCAMHAKYDVLEQSCIMDFFETPYFAWVDIGLFRKLDGSDYPPFKLIPPEKFNPETIGFSEVSPSYPFYTPEYIMLNKVVWVSGSMVLATKAYMLNFSRDYKDAVKELLAKGLSNTDQETIHSMYSSKMHKSHYVKITTYSCQQGQYELYGPAARYFCLGYMCKNAWEKRFMGLGR